MRMDMMWGRFEAWEHWKPQKKEKCPEKVLWGEEGGTLNDFTMWTPFPPPLKMLISMQNLYSIACQHMKSLWHSQDTLLSLKRKRIFTFHTVAFLRLLIGAMSKQLGANIVNTKAQHRKFIQISTN